MAFSSTSRVTVIACCSRGEPSGHLAFISKENAGYGFIRNQIIDLAVASDDPVVTE